MHPTDRGLGAPRQRTVFASYAHDSQEHKQQVLTLAHLLISHGVDVKLDQLDTERKDWSSWATSHMTSADYIIVVASPGYRQAGDGHGPPDLNRGVQYESAVLRDLLHGDRKHWLPRLLPVVLPGRAINEIPLFLQPHTADHYLVPELTAYGIRELLAVIKSPDINEPTVDIPAPRQAEPEPWLLVRLEIVIRRRK